MVFNATLNNIAVLSWQSVLLVGESRVSAENNRPVVSQQVTQSGKFYTGISYVNMVSVNIKYDQLSLTRMVKVLSLDKKNN
jgi:hypothetical protein